MDPSSQAFQDFMLGGKASRTPTPSKTPSRSSSSSKKKTSKRFGPIVKAFQGRIQDWKDADDQLYQVLNSIVNLRNRIWWETKVSLQHEPKPWESSGFRSNKMFLLPSDVDMAVDHDLLQHEKMMAGARTLISSMASAQEAVGRRLDELYLMEHEVPQNVVNAALEVYHFLGEELYHKQIMVNKVIDSCHNGLLASKEESEETIVASNPRNVAQTCFAGWRGGGEKKEGWMLVDEYLGGEIF